jgi:hypothetical protein
MLHYSTLSRSRAWSSVIRISLAILVLCFSITVGCRKMESPNTPPTEGVVTTTIAGQVVDESGAPIPAVQITAYAHTVTTDANGLFSIPNINVGASRAFVIAKKPNYFNAARAAAPTVNGVTYMKLMMAQSTIIGNINASNGGTVTMPSGASVRLSSGGVVTNSGTPYSGAVSVSARHLDPSKPNFAMLFAGDLTGERTDTSQTQMQSFGVIIAELHGSNGELLQPAAGKPATITLPISASLQSKAPTSIPLWYFDETLGMWKEEGVATKSGSTYTGNVQHFSFWNYDMQCDYGWVTGQIVCSDVPIPGVVVNMDAFVEGGLPMVITDAEGKFRVKVPPVGSRGQAVLQVLASESGGLYWTNTPMPINVPPNVTTDLGQIALSSPCPSYLAGSLKDCDGALTTGMVVANWSGGMSYAYTTTGTFKIIAPASYQITLSATAASGAVAQPQTVTAGTQGAQVTAGDLIACNNASSDVQLDINGSFDGGFLTFTPDGTRLATVDANGSDVVIFEVSTGNKVSTIAGVYNSNSSARWLKFSPDGSKILTYSGYDERIGKPYVPSVLNCWSVSGTKLTTTPIPATSACFTRDGSAVIGAAYQQVFEYDLALGQASKTFTVPGYQSMIAGLAAGGNQFVVLSFSGSSGTIQLWDISTDKAVSSFPLTTMIHNGDSLLGGGVSMMSYDRNVVAVAGATTIHFYDLAASSEISTSTITSPFGSSYGIAPDNASYIGQYRVGLGNTVGLFKLSDGSSTHVFDPAAGAGQSNGVAISPDGKYAAAVYPNSIRIWKVQ